MRAVKGLAYNTKEKKRGVWLLATRWRNGHVRKTSGPFLLQDHERVKGKPYTRALFSLHFNEARKSLPEFDRRDLHGSPEIAVIGRAVLPSRLGRSATS
jgi:hypothetical protein